MNILYLHGLESKLSAEKREILKPYGNIFAPDLDYHKNPHSIESIIKDHEPTPIDVVIGSSMGGFAGYYVSSLLNVPALLFNPALYARSVPQVTPTLDKPVQNYKRIILGLEDDIVDPSRTLRFLSENLETQGGLEIKLRPKMQHRVAVPVFEEEIREFFRTITPGNTI